MNQDLIKNLYFSEIISCDFDSINGIVIFTIKGEEVKNRIVQFNGVSEFIFTRSNNMNFDSSISFYPIEDIIIKNDMFKLKKNLSNSVEIHYNAVIDSCVSTWYVYAKEMIVDNQLITLNQL